MTKQDLINRISEADESEHFTLIVISQRPEHLGFCGIDLLSTQDKDFMTYSINYAHSALDR